MARVNTYTQDSVVSGIDKVLGTDVHTGATKNFTFNSVSEWLNSAGAVKIIGQNNYVFQSVGEFPEDRLAGNISFLNFGGDGTLFSDVTELIFSDASAGNTSAAPYITTLVGKQVILANLNDLSNFGVYTLQSFIELDTEPRFYQATLVFVSGSGALYDATAYGFAAEGLQPEAPVIPTLDAVTDAGDNTTNSIQVGGLTVTGTFKNYDEATPDIGAKQDNDLRGYGDKYISNKTIAYSRISSAAFDEEGAIRIKDNVFQTYIGGEWQDVVTNFRFREDENGNFELEHKPIGFTGWIEVNSGNSDLLGLNGLPITQNYATSMGAYPVPLQLDGGTF